MDLSDVLSIRTNTSTLPEEIKSGDKALYVLSKLKQEQEYLFLKHILFNNKLIFCAGKSLYAWDLDENKVDVIQTYTSYVNKLRNLPNNKFILCTGDGTVQVRDKDLKIVKEIKNDSEVFSCDNLSDDRIVTKDLLKVKVWSGETEVYELVSRELGDRNRIVDVRVHDDKIYVIFTNKIRTWDNTLLLIDERKFIFEINSCTYYKNRILFTTTDRYVGLYPGPMGIAQAGMHPDIKFLDDGTILVGAPSNSIIVSVDGKNKLKDFKTKYTVAAQHDSKLVLGNYEGEVLIDGFPKIKVCDKSIIDIKSLDDKRILILTIDTKNPLFILTLKPFS